MTMRSQKAQPHHTWSWSEILPAVCETDASLRRKLQRGQVELEQGSDSTRTRATLWDIARLRVSRYLCDLNIEAKRAFALAEVLIERAYKKQMDGASFNQRSGEKQKFLYVIAQRPGANFRIVEVDPVAPDEGLIELGLVAASEPASIIVPVHPLILDAWYSLPNLTDDVAAWLRASSANLRRLKGN